ncbi:unnamed protein product [Lactuca virosa]|uniref:DUF4283 domain-containing protein n=1 Tax=Lactuca virosa TaxID=75947 RepID=A0AAU9PE71_9ASTR|nr:unnamed protein product [Lactuca virosa]
MFKWIDLACKKEPRFERIAWLKFTVVPLITWDEYNFDAIAMQYGKILTQAKTFASCSDISYGKVGIITSHRKKINEEIIGILNELVEEGDKDVEDDESDAISDTYDMLHVEQEDLEDGEIDQNNKFDEVPVTGTVPDCQLS